MIRTVLLTKKYDSFAAVDGLSLSIHPGEIYGFLGPNGAGKTSTIMMLLGMSRPTSGQIFLFDEPFGPERLDLRMRIGVVPEKHPHGTLSWITGREYLELFADLFHMRNPGARIQNLLERVGLLNVQNKRVAQYSFGMLQKLSFVRALLHDPDILILDEPISGLDPLGVKQVRDLILSEKREGRTVMISSHQLSEMEKICNRIAIIFQGRLVAEDSMSALLARIGRDREVRVELETVPRGIGETLKKDLPFVLDCSVEEGLLVIRIVKEGNYRKALSEYLFGKNLIPLQIVEKPVSLEEAFVTITQENIGLFTSRGEGE